MGPTEEILKHLPEVLTVAKVAAGSIPFTGIVKRMLGLVAGALVAIAYWSASVILKVV